MYKMYNNKNDMFYLICLKNYFQVESKSIHFAVLKIVTTFF